jgi:hypothetical protein
MDEVHRYTVQLEQIVTGLALNVGDDQVDTEGQRRRFVL